MDSVEAEGSSIDDAIARAVARLGVTRDRVAVEILANATRGLFGFGRKPARVRATLRRRSDTDGTPVVAGPASDAVLERARVVLSEIVRLTGVVASVDAVRDGDVATLVIGGAPSGVLVGRYGQTLDALEYLVNRIASDTAHHAARVVVDADGYRARRRADLERQARQLAARVRAAGKPLSLNPLPPRERRIVHLALQGDAAVTTRSTGAGYVRRVVIVPASPGGAGLQTRVPRSAAQRKHKRRG